jgi:CHAT domain-containing protein
MLELNRSKKWGSSLFLVTLISLGVINIQEVTATTNNYVIQQGIEAYQKGNLPEAIARWQEGLKKINNPLDKATIYNNLALAYKESGKNDLAINSWEETLKIYRSEKQGNIAKILTELAQIYANLGQHRKAISLSEQAIKIAQTNEDQVTLIAASGILGNGQSFLGDFDQAKKTLESALNLARQTNNYNYIATTLNNLGNVYVNSGFRASILADSAVKEGDDQQEKKFRQIAEEDLKQAQILFQESAETPAGFESIKGLINLSHLQDKIQGKTVSNWSKVKEDILSLPSSNRKIYALINIANKLDTQEKLPTLETALDLARKIQDKRAESFAIGSLGTFYEQEKQYSQAREFTQKAQFIAQSMNAFDSLYRWQWQAGRIFQATGKTDQAILSYQQAIASLQSIRSDLVAVNQDVQFDFREQIEPVYRQLIGLFLEKQAISPSNNNLKEVIDTLELLKLAELENFFGDECVEVDQSVSVEKILQQNNTAVIYSVILDDHTEMILRSPDGQMKNYRVALNKQELEKQATQLRYFQEYRSTEEYIRNTRQFYDLLIRPMEADLAKINPKTILAINDGMLRNISFAALSDGNEFLIEKYALATTPSLSLTTGKVLNKEKLAVLALGLTVAKPPFAPLNNVASELRAIAKILPGQELLNEKFTLNNFEKQISRQTYPIVHIATHGKFGVDGANTFLVGYDQNISISELDNILRSRPTTAPIELLTMSACQTAAGDDRSTLGIAGVAVRAGASSALATLWYINDQATVPLIEEFYTQLRKPGVSKAEALRQAQLKMIKDPNYNHPGVWSPFTIIGNWF